MPTIAQLPPAGSVNLSDELPLSQAGFTRAIAVADFLAGTQPAIAAPTGTLLGRISIGPGGPEPITLGAGLALTASTLSSTAASITSLPPVTTITAVDLVGISQGGADHTISYANLINGQTIDVAQPAIAATDTDSFWVAQGSATMLRQSLSAIWSWLQLKLPGYKRPVVELSSNATLDGTTHNGRILICSAALTLTPAFINMGTGFCCDVINLSAGNVVFGPGIVTSSGSTVLLPGQFASLRAAAYSGGNIVFAATPPIAAGALAVPGQPTALLAGSVSQSTLGLTWVAPAFGGTAASYSVLYRVGATGTWLVASSTVTAVSYTLTGLNAGVAYNIQVVATNATGAGAASAILTISTTASGLVTSVVWNLAPAGSFAHGNGSIGVNAHFTPAAGPAQFGFSTSATTPPGSWTSGSNVSGDLWAAYVAVPATPGNWYSWASGTDGSALTAYATPFVVT